VLALPAGCASVSYLGQAAWGQARVLAARRPLERVIADPRTQPSLRTQLALVRDLRAFAATDLAMTGVSGFADYAALGRDYAVWNVVATPEFSLRPLSWCFPVAGCVAYRGYFGRAAAERQAVVLARQGFDTHVYGVAAYSTLGWFDDPVLDTWVRRPESALAALLFHELAHQLVYAPHDTAFSESFARVVEREGVRRWFARSGREAQTASWLREQAVVAQFNALLAAARTRLEALYVQPLARGRALRCVDARAAQQRASRERRQLRALGAGADAAAGGTRWRAGALLRRGTRAGRARAAGAGGAIAGAGARG